MDIENEKVDIQEKGDIESVLSEKGSDFSVKTTIQIHRLFEKFGFDEVFGRSAVMELLELKGQVLQYFFPIWCRQILLSQYPVTEKANINSRSSVYLIWSFIRFFLKLSTQRVDNPMFYFQQKKREKRAELEEISEGLITAYANKFSNK